MEIYLLTNTINGKRYVGKAATTARRRWSQHKSRAAHAIKNPAPISSAIRKYGANAFTVEVLSSHTSIDELNEAEKAAIAFYDTMNRARGYNILDGGIGAPHGNRNRVGKHHTETAKERIRAGHLGLKYGPMSDSHRQRISEATKGKPKRQHSRRSPSAETLAKMRRPTGKPAWNTGLSIKKGTLTISPESLQRMRKGIGNLRPHPENLDHRPGRRYSPTAKANMSKAARRRIQMRDSKGQFKGEAKVPA